MGSSSATSQQLTGTVKKFDKDSKELTLSDSDKKLRVSDDTQIMKDGQQGSISDIKEGDQVRASYSGTGDTLQVNRLEVMSSGATGTEKSTGTTTKKKAKKHSTSSGTSGTTSGSKSDTTGSSAGSTDTTMGGSSGAAGSSTGGSTTDTGTK
ncbi:hypothetical protein [Anaeromyxobacter oryzae]|uniref:DUF5666 domain-containing protein n=1 Tax=Anaeromyxobacter oryzae TaxID=2918170 RepID=A0ABM7X3T3_9BACT|nr:hypothetical protein [Anaeromyxobacter oryzae]BDG06462.1 hypothetical protein AMOR_54580 [Anaeromyxobacter oryzae]